MRLTLIVILLQGALFIVFPVAAQGVNSPVVTSPVAGQVLQGQVAITGTTDIPNFASAEMDFGYSADKTNSKFLIQTMTQPIANNILATWDTTTISDGDYILLLRVNLTDGTFQEITVAVKVRNYTSLPSPTPTVILTEPALQIPTPILLVPTATPTLSPLPTPTTLPPNSVTTGENEIFTEFWRGGLIVLFLFFVFGVTLRLRRS